MREQDAKNFLKIRGIIEKYNQLKDEDKDELSKGHDIQELNVNERKNLIYLLGVIGLNESFNKKEFRKVTNNFYLLIHQDKIDSITNGQNITVFEETDLSAISNLFKVVSPALQFVKNWFNENNDKEFTLINDLPKSSSQDFSETRCDHQDSSQPFEHQDSPISSPGLDPTMSASDFLEELSIKLFNTESESKPKFSIFNLFTRCIYDRSSKSDVCSLEELKQGVFKILTDYRREKYIPGSKEDEFIINATNLSEGRLTKDQAKAIFNIIAPKAISDDKLGPYFLKSFYDRGELNRDTVKFFVNSVMISSGVEKPLDQRSGRASRYSV